MIDSFVALLGARPPSHIILKFDRHNKIHPPFSYQLISKKLAGAKPAGDLSRAPRRHCL